VCSVPNDFKKVSQQEQESWQIGEDILKMHEGKGDDCDKSATKMNDRY